ncbi:MAG: PDZ domain-containing protein [Polyangiales bacterium]
MTSSTSKRLAKELTVLALSALACAIGARITAANALAARTGPRRSAAIERAREASREAPVAIAPAAPTVGPVANPTPRAPTRARRAQLDRSASSAPRASSDPWVELRPRLYERSDGTLRADLRDVSNLSEFARGMRARAAPDGGFEVLSLDAQGYLAAAGVRAGDRLVAMNGRSTRTLDELLTAYALGRLGSTVSLQFARGQGHYAINAEVLRGERATPP